MVQGLSQAGADGPQQGAELRLRVEQIDPLTDPRWDRLVERHPLSWLSHTSAWARVLVESFPHLTPCYLGLTESDGELRAALPLFRVQSWLLGPRLVSTPFSTRSCPLANSVEEENVLMQNALDLAKAEGIPLEIRTIGNDRELNLDSRLSVSTDYCTHDLRISAAEDRPPRHLRRAVRKARAKGLSCRIAETEEDLATFYRLYVWNRKRNNLPPLPPMFFEKQWGILQPSGLMVLLLAENERGTLLAGLQLYVYRGRVSGETMAWDSSFADSYPSHFVWWQGIGYARHNGFEYFDFGRTNLSNEGLMEFKRRWEAEVVDLPIWSYPTSLGQMREGSLSFRILQTACRLTPRKWLPALGRFCFRHSG